MPRECDSSLISAWCVCQSPWPFRLVTVMARPTGVRTPQFVVAGLGDVCLRFCRGSGATLRLPTAIVGLGGWRIARALGETRPRRRRFASWLRICPRPTGSNQRASADECCEIMAWQSGHRSGPHFCPVA